MQRNLEKICSPKDELWPKGDEVLPNGVSFPNARVDAAPNAVTSWPKVTVLPKLNGWVLEAPMVGVLEIQNVGVLEAPKAGPLVAPNAELVVPNAGVMVDPNTGVLVAPEAGWLIAPKGWLPKAACFWPKILLEELNWPRVRDPNTSNALFCPNADAPAYEK